MTPSSRQSLARHYSRFRVGERILLTGHSHQAWPDVGFEGQQRAWLDAADLVDGKWAAAERQAELVREGVRRILGEPRGEIALGQNTHELLVRLLSALPLDRRPRLLTTDGEFHTIRRQLDRLAEAGLEVERVPSRPADAIAERLAAAVDDRTAAVLVSSVLFTTGEIVPGLARVAEACARVGAELVVDAYHHLNVVPFDVEADGLAGAFVLGGGYKYLQLGEGNCFLRVPPGCRLRPVITGWFAEFGLLDHAGADHAVPYGEGAARFAGSTYDPTSHYRAAAVLAFEAAHALTPHACVPSARCRPRVSSARSSSTISTPLSCASSPSPHWPVRVSWRSVRPMPRDSRGGSASGAWRAMREVRGCVSGQRPM
ncbi:MAG: aminotransferase class V-fold PLP-dependent enzyme [Vicinamibacterales bacterium]